MLNYNIGDIVEVTDNTCAHEFKIGDLVVIVEKCEEGRSMEHYRARLCDLPEFSYGSYGWFISEEELKTPSKSKLKKYMEVQQNAKN